ncbi:MAG: adenylate/guanylate cyclase domain-containing protein [SAR324 cluster bacterium]|nr:adenylate/guanylate cyclase domain-containing protein [SAR324 cluster bacterium]
MKKVLSWILKLTPLRISLFLTATMLGLYSYNIAEPSNYLNLLDKKWVDFIQKNRGTVAHTDQIVIVAVDAKSVDKYGRWPWSRGVIAQAVKSLTEYYHVGTIGFDIVFSEAADNHLRLAHNFQQEYIKNHVQQTPAGEKFLNYMRSVTEQEDGDAIFGRQYAQTSNVVLGYTFFSEENVAHLSPEEVKKEQKRLRHSAIRKIKGYGKLKKALLPEGYYPELNINKIAGRKPLQGYFNVQIDREDGVVRRVQTIVRVNKRFYPSLDLQMLANYLGETIELIGDESGILEIKMGERSLYPFPDGSFLINYKGPEKTFPHYSMADVIERTVPAEKLKGKMVFMGVTEVGILDLRVVPVSEAYAGVEVHANLLDNLLTDSYFRLNFDNDMYTLGLILAIGLILGLVMPRMKLGYSIALVITIVIGYTLFHQYAVTSLLTWPSYIYVLMSILITAGGVTQYMFFISDRDKRFIKVAFQQYLSPAVINQLMDDPDMLQLGGEERVMTALFSDVKGFSSISEKLTPTQLVQLLNEYLTEMSSIIMKYEGTVDKFEGDAIIAFFGAPVKFSDHATRGALVCLEMQNRLAEMRHQWRKEGRIELFHRIGINTGPMVVGNMGSSSRFDYTMMGNSVNLAARLEGVNKMYQNEILMSEMTYGECKDSIEARELDLIRVIGINEPVRIYEILGRIGEVDSDRKKAFDIYAEGLDLYRQKNWDKAEKSFKGVLERIPDDGPSSVFLSRCEEYRIAPPPQEWDGVYVATSK